MAKWQQLIAARERKHLSQLEAAEHLNVGLVTYQRWEAGRAKPQPQHMRRLHEIFGKLLELAEMGRWREDASAEKNTADMPPHATVWKDSSEARHIVAPAEEIDEPQAFIAAHLTPHLWSLAFMEHPEYADKLAAIRQAIKDFDAMNTDNKNYQITRREALCSLAALPLITFGLNTPGKTVPPAQYGNVLAQCAASIEACWELTQSSDASDIVFAFKNVSKYLPILKSIVNNSSQHRKEAANLTAHYAILKTILGWHHKGLTEAIHYAKEAVVYSQEAEDISLQLSAYSKLAWAYLYDKKYKLALETAQEAQFLLEQTTTPLPSCIQSGTYSTLALMQVKNGRAADSTLGKVTEIDPGDKTCAFMEFTRSDLPREVGLIHYYRGDQIKATESLEKIIDPVTLVAKIPAERRGRIEVFNTMALSVLKSKDRDMEKTVQFWMVAIEEARALQSTWGFNEALATYELMEVAWPGEQRIAELRDLIVHW